MPSKLQGSTTLQLQTSVLSWTPDGGWVRTKTWHGQKADVENRAIVEALWSATATSVNSSPISNNTHQLVITYADTDVPAENTPDDSSVWELASNEIQEELIAHPVFANTAKVTLADHLAIQDALDANTEYTNAVRPKALELWNYLRQGVETYQSSQPVIKQTVSRHRSNGNFNVDYTNTNRVVTLSSIDPPATILGALGQLPFPNDAGGVNTGQFEWLKKMPRTTISQKGYLVTVHYEWWGAEKWPLTMYGGSYTPTP